jgi:hypothetical protein
MKLGLQNYAVIMTIEKTCLNFNNKKLYSLKMHDFAQNCRIIDGVVQLLSQHNLKVSHHGHI